MTIPDYTRWPGLVLSAPQSLYAALSKFAMMRVAAEAGVSTPRTSRVKDECDLAIAACAFGFPLIIKGDRGESGNHVRIVRSSPELLRAYREIVLLEQSSGDQGVLLQEYVAGIGYSVGGLFHHGRPLRVCAHRKRVGVPPLGGLTVRGVTERPPALLQDAFRIFEALEYTGLGHVEFIRDQCGRFRFLEINPRVWGTIGVGEYAGVDFYTPYIAIAQGAIPEPDLRFSEGVTFHRIGREGKMMRVQPSRIAGFLRDCLDPRVRSDFEWFDPLPHLAAFAARGLGSTAEGKRVGSKPS
jgi:biotin carboxylase